MKYMKYIRCSIHVFEMMEPNELCPPAFKAKTMVYIQPWIFSEASFKPEPIY